MSRIVPLSKTILENQTSWGRQVKTKAELTLFMIMMLGFLRMASTQEIHNICYATEKILGEAQKQI